MKTELTAEQSKHLISLGVPEHFASMTANQLRGEPYYNDYYQEIFTLTDLLKILPKEIKFNNGIFNLNIEFWNDIVNVIYCVGGMFPLAIKTSKEIIDALYELVCWYYEVYLKSEKK